MRPTSATWTATSWTFFATAEYKRAVLATGSVFVLLLGLYSGVVYHLIILGEERYLQAVHGPEFERYRQQVRRYL